MFISIELESEDESDLPDFCTFKKMRDGSRTLETKVQSLNDKSSELQAAIAAPRSRTSDAQLRWVLNSELFGYLFVLTFPIEL